MLRVKNYFDDTELLPLDIAKFIVFPDSNSTTSRTASDIIKNTENIFRCVSQLPFVRAKEFIASYRQNEAFKKLDQIFSNHPLPLDLNANDILTYALATKNIYTIDPKLLENAILDVEKLLEHKNMEKNDKIAECLKGLRITLTAIKNPDASAEVNLLLVKKSSELKKAGTFINLTGINLAGLNHTRPNLRFINLDGIDLHKAYLEAARLSGASLEETNLRGANLQDADLSVTNSLQVTSLQRADLRSADLRRAKINTFFTDGRKLIGVNMNNANLQDANLQYAELKGVQLVAADLRGADLSNAVMAARVEIDNHNAFNPITTYIIKCNLANANLSGTNLACANLEWADLKGANLKEANLACANLEHADLQDANLTNANLDKSNLKDANFTGAIFLEDTITTDTIAAQLSRVANQIKDHAEIEKLRQAAAHDLVSRMKENLEGIAILNMAMHHPIFFPKGIIKKINSIFSYDMAPALFTKSQRILFLGREALIRKLREQVAPQC